MARPKIAAGEVHRSGGQLAVQQHLCVLNVGVEADRDDVGTLRAQERDRIARSHEAPPDRGDDAGFSVRILTG